MNRRGLWVDGEVFETEESCGRELDEVAAVEGLTGARVKSVMYRRQSDEE
jgi:hypothetical protein